MSDGLFIFLVLSAGVIVIALTSGFADPMPGLFNVINRINSKETTAHNDMKTFKETMTKRDSRDDH